MIHTGCKILFLYFVLILTPRQGFVQDTPPYMDYCAFLERDIHGKKHGFLAGNLLYYVGGQSSAEYNIMEHETLGFTHGFFRDGRSRGHGIITDEYGTGNDKWGWEFYRRTRIAYGTVKINNTEYKNPVPSEVIWRPDQMICTYRIGGITITEKKFISLNDVLVSIITSSQPVTLIFEGNSFVNLNHIPTWNGDLPGITFSQERNSTAEFDTSHNAIHIVENGTAMVKPNWGTPAIEGKLMYDGMSVVLSSTEDISNTSSITKDNEGRQIYSFRTRCDENGISIAFAMGDDYQETVTRVEGDLADPESALQDKSDYINDLLNNQIPYFRCSDADVEKVYYYLWSLYFMYMIDVGEGWESYPHTQTAVNNFMGLHNFDSYAFIPMGSWIADKETFAYGNALTWKYLLPYKNENNFLPDNLGIAWFSPVWMNLNGHVEGALQIYKHSGDLNYLNEIYAFYRELYWTRMLLNWGIGLNALDALKSMASYTGNHSDISHWQSMIDELLPLWQNGWDGINFYGPSGIRDVLNLASMMYYDMPDEWARKLVNNWVMNSEVGYLGEVPLNIRAKDSQQIPPFGVSSLSTYLAVEGMYRQHTDDDAIFCTLGHLNGMVKNYGFPVAPESWDQNYDPWGSEYYNWDGAILLLLIEQIAGIHYSIPDSTFTICDHMPKTWEYQDVYVPVSDNDILNWTRVRVERTDNGTSFDKTVTVTGNQLRNLRIQPWLEDRNILSANPTADGLNDPSGHIGYEFNGVADAIVELTLSANHNPTGIFIDNAKIAENKPVGSLVDLLTAKDADEGNLHDYVLTTGAGDEDNNSFIISEDSLLAGAIFDFETKSKYNIRLQTSDDQGGYYSESFIINIEDNYEGPDSTILDTLAETFTGPELDLGIVPEGYWEYVYAGGIFNGQGQYTVQTDSGFVGLRGDIGQGDFEAVFEVSRIDWISDFSKVNWEFRDDDNNWIIFFIEKGDNWMSFLVDMWSDGNSSRQVQVPISVPNSVKFKVQWTELSKEWRVHYGLNGNDPVIEPKGSPITDYLSHSRPDRWMFLQVGQWQDGKVAADFDFFEMKKDSPVTIRYESESFNPESILLYQNYPNPFNPVTTIRYTVGAYGQTPLKKIDLSIYNLLGQKVTTLVSEQQPAGNYRVQWDASGIAAGIYLCKLSIDKYSYMRKMILIK